MLNEINTHKNWKRQTTSASAALKAAMTTAPNNRVRVVLMMYRHFTRGLTCDECAEKLGRRITSIRPRMSELYDAGYVRDTGARRDTQDGNTAIVWTLTQKGLTAAHRLLNGIPVNIKRPH